MKLVIVRHGEYGSGDHLTERARESMTRLATELKSNVSEPLILTSPITRAKETAEILHKALGGELVEDKNLVANYLRDGNYMTPDKARSYLIDIRNSKFDILLTTHIDLCGLFLDILKTDFSDLEVLNLSRGEAVLFDFENKTTTSFLR